MACYGFLFLPAAQVLTWEYGTGIISNISGWVGADISGNYQQQHEEFYLINIGPEHVKLSQEKQQITSLRHKIGGRCFDFQNILTS